jgi:hypothetical protein
VVARLTDGGGGTIVGGMTFWTFSSRRGFAAVAVMAAAQRAYVTSFFDRWLRGRDDHLLDGPSPRYPDVVFVP